MCETRSENEGEDHNRQPESHPLSPNGATISTVGYCRPVNAACRVTAPRSVQETVFLRKVYSGSGETDLNICGSQADRPVITVAAQKGLLGISEQVRRKRPPAAKLRTDVGKSYIT